MKLNIQEILLFWLNDPFLFSGFESAFVPSPPSENTKDRSFYRQNWEGLNQKKNEFSFFPQCA